MHTERIVITGSNGLIGSLLVEELKGDYELYRIDTQGEMRGIWSNARFFKLDISDAQKLKKVFSAIQPTACIIHLAGISSSRAKWEPILKNNIIGTRNLYECAREFGVRKVIFASSNHVTGGYETSPPSVDLEQIPKLISVEDPLRPDGDYASSKAFGEIIARQYYELYGIRSICLRIGSVLKSDDPRNEKRHLNTWLSHKDLIQLVRKSLQTDVEFGIYYGVSNNEGRFWDIQNAKNDLGYFPNSNASMIK